MKKKKLESDEKGAALGNGQAEGHHPELVRHAHQLPVGQFFVAGFLWQTQQMTRLDS